ncbi:unnamed protein product [Symbiodinium sp. CCMP2592]|nr:unnamed protein product [Symbiodinium sp. CCMP2592]
MFYCPFCCTPLGVPEGVTVPRARLPFARCDIIFDDAPKKATSIHAKVLAPEQVRLIDLFTTEANTNRTLSRPGGGSATKALTRSALQCRDQGDPRVRPSHHTGALPSAVPKALRPYSVQSCVGSGMAPSGRQQCNLRGGQRLE